MQQQVASDLMPRPWAEGGRRYEGHPDKGGAGRRTWQNRWKGMLKMTANCNTMQQQKNKNRNKTENIAVREGMLAVC